MATSRFAPSCTGRAHPGTLLAALLAWLDARRSGGRILLRLEDLDPGRCRPELTWGLVEDLAWFGLDWDGIERQSDQGTRHAAALDALAAAGVLYPCSRSRAELQALGRRAPDGSWTVDGRERGRSLPPGGWRASIEPLRVAIPADLFQPRDDSGLDLAQEVAEVAGDPVVRRRDGAVAYQLACVVDDGATGVDRVVRGRDLALSSATQVALQGLLGLPTPIYRHHLLLQEAGAGRKLSKFHGAVAVPELRRVMTAEELCGLLAACAGLLPEPRPCQPRELVADFAWSQVQQADPVLAWDGHRLALER